MHRSCAARWAQGGLNAGTGNDTGGRASLPAHAWVPARDSHTPWPPACLALASIQPPGLCRADTPLARTLVCLWFAPVAGGRLAVKSSNGLTRIWDCDAAKPEQLRAVASFRVPADGKTRCLLSPTHDGTYICAGEVKGRGAQAPAHIVHDRGVPRAVAAWGCGKQAVWNCQ